MRLRTPNIESGVACDLRPVFLRLRLNRLLTQSVKHQDRSKDGRTNGEDADIGADGRRDNEGLNCHSEEIGCRMISSWRDTNQHHCCKSELRTMYIG
jgi:hypothetical protein